MEAAEQWEPDDARVSRPVLRERGAATAPRHSPRHHIAGKKHWLWRAVDQEGFVLDVLVQSRRDKKAAKRLLRKLLKQQGRAPRVLITDKLRATVPPSGRSCPASSTASIKASTIGRRIRTNRRDDESGS